MVLISSDISSVVSSEANRPLYAVVARLARIIDRMCRNEAVNSELLYKLTK